MKRIINIIILCAFCNLAIAIEKVNLALVYDGAQSHDDIFYSLVQGEIRDLLANEFDIAFVEYIDNWDIRGANAALTNALQSPDIDLVISLGVLSSYAALQKKDINKGLIIGYDVSIFFAKSPGDISKLNSNIAYYSGQKSILHELSVFKEVTHANKIAIVGDTSMLSGQVPSIEHIIESNLHKLGMEGVFIPVTTSTDVVIESLDSLDVNGVLLLPTWRLKPEEFQKMVNQINSKKLPSFSISGENEVEKGVLMTTIPYSELKRAARRVALNTQELLLSGNTEEIDIDFKRGKELIINEKTMDALQIDLPWKIRDIARFVDPPNTYQNSLSLWDATEIAIEQNLDLDVERWVVKAGKEDVLTALSRLLPQINSGAVARIIDANSARFARGYEPERVIRGKLRLDQSVYEDDLVAGYTIEKNIQQAREYNKDTTQLDIIFDTTVAYLLVLKIQAEKEIAIENLDLTKANLRRAQELVNSGHSRLSEVYRWQSAESSNREDLLTIQANLDNIETEFNRLLNRPLKSRVLLDDMRPSNFSFLTSLEDFEKLISSPLKMENFKGFMTSLANDLSPEIKSIGEEIKAQERKFTSTKRAFYLPKFKAFAEVGKNLAKSGAGDSPPPGLSNSKSQKAAGIELFYPLFTGGERKAAKYRAFFDLQKLKTEKASLTLKIDENVINSIDNLKSSFDGIYWAKKAELAGMQNLRIVTESYARGVVSIVDLIDAQNTAITAKQNHSDAIYDFLIDMMSLQRAVGSFVHYMPASEQSMLKTSLMQKVLHRSDS